MLAAVPSAAQTIQSIAAIVNDEVVSDFDVNQRIDLIMISTGLQNTPDVRARLRGQVIRTLVDERLQIQEANRLNIRVRAEELQQAISQIEGENNIPAGRFADYVRARGITLEAVTAQLTAAIVWQKLVQRRLRPRVSVSDEEVETAAARLKANAGQDEYLLSEIFLSVESPALENDVQRRALRLVEQIRGGARFAAVAREFSQAVTAAVGGDMGWVRPGQLPQEVERAVIELPIPGISRPIRAVGGYYIMVARDKRQILGGSSGDLELDLKQVLLPLAASATPEEINRQTALAERLRGRLGGCDDVAAVAAELGSSDSGSLGKIRAKDLPATIRAAVIDLADGGVSVPVRTASGLHIFVVCGRSGGARAAAVDEKAIRNEIGARRLTMLARRYLRDLRRDAMVEIR